MENIKNTETHCPSCGKFTGTYERCPYCGTEVEKRISIKVFRYGSVLLAVLGVFFIWLAAINQETPELDLTKLSETMNFAFTRVKGKVMGNVRTYYNEVGGVSGLNFTVLSGTKEIRIMAYSAVAQEIIDNDNIPDPGEEVEVKGSLRIKDAGQSLALYIQVGDHLVVKREPIEKKDFWTISSEDEGKKYEISGIISGIRKSSSNAPGRIYITSKEGKSGVLTVWNTVIDSVEKSYGEKFVKGAEFSAKVIVNLYRGQKQLLLNFPQHLKLNGKINGDVFKVRKIDQEIVKSMEGQTVELTGVISEVFKINMKKGDNYLKKLVVKYSYGIIDVIIWKNVDEKFGYDLKSGDKITLTGKINIFEDKLQLVPADSDTLKVLSSGNKVEKVTSEVKTTVQKSISDNDSGVITEKDKWTIITKTGKVYKKKDINGNISYDFRYGNNNKITLFIKKAVIKYKKEVADLRDGTEIKVTGKVDVFKGNIELVVNHSNSIEILGDK